MYIWEEDKIGEGVGGGGWHSSERDRYDRGK